MINVDHIQELATPVFRKHQVVLAYLFGSHARGTAGNTSDVDVAVVFDTDGISPAQRVERDTAFLNSLEDALQKSVDVVDLGLVVDPLLRHRAVRGGVLLFCANDSQRHQLELAALHEYEDTRHLRDVQYRAMNKRIEAGTFGQAI